MITEENARSIVLRRSGNDEGGLRLAIQSCELSPRGDFWIIHANSEDYVVRGIREHMLIGVSAYMVDAVDGNLTIVGSGQSWQEFLQDKYDEDAAGSMSYVVEPTFSRDDKGAVINLRQRLDCSLQTALLLLSSEHRQWFTGSRREMLRVREILHERGIETEITLRDVAGNAIEFDYSMWYWNALASRIRLRFQPI